MPNNQVKTKEEERLWNQAETIVRNEYKDVQEGTPKYYKLVSSIYQRLKGKSNPKTELEKTIS